jgi:hypothetical protein
VAVPLPPGIELDRHLHLDDSRWSLALRRAILALLALFVAAALLNRFGQRPATQRAGGATGALTVVSPVRARSGLMFTTRFTIAARRQIAHPRLVLDPGWFDGMQVNSIVPQPANETSVGGRTVFTFASLPAGGRQDYFVGFQIDPTTVGRQRQTARLFDGSALLATVRGSLTVLP